MTLDVYSSGTSGCAPGFDGLSISIDWPATLGRWATRYGTSAVIWGVGVVSLITFHSVDPNGALSSQSGFLD